MYLPASKTLPKRMDRIEGTESHIISKSCMVEYIPEVEFLKEIQTEVLRVFLLAIHRHLY
jgi:hypothetical protein